MPAPEFPLTRVVDDLLVLTSNRREALKAYADLNQLLTAAGMPLTRLPGSTVNDRVSGDATALLGHELAQDPGEFETRIAEKVRYNLGLSLTEAYDRGSPTRHANNVNRGWHQCLGPCYQNPVSNQVDERVRRAANQRALE